ncbi:MAG: sel1 repeat family protein [Verrucomicrobia bacterium]|nr:sel1 repeat family protein [Verrucomicrobiota bacterium]
MVDAVQADFAVFAEDNFATASPDQKGNRTSENSPSERKDLTKEEKVAVAWWKNPLSWGPNDLTGSNPVKPLKEEKEIVKKYRIAAEQGNAEAQLNLGKCYLSGHGIAQDEKEAVTWFQKSSEQGNVDADYELGTCYFEGRGVAKDRQAAFKWFQKSAELGQARAQYKVGNCYFHGWGVAVDEKKAFEWIEKAAKQGNSEAKQMLDEVIFQT